MARRTQVTASIFDTEGYVFITFRGNPQDVADCAALYVQNVGDPLIPAERYDVELIRHREEEEEP